MCWPLKKLFDAIFSKQDVNWFSSFSCKGPHKICPVTETKGEARFKKAKSSWQKPPQTDVFMSYISIPCSVKNWLDDIEVPTSF